MISDKTLNRMALASFAYGCFILITYAALVYSIFWRGEFLPMFPGPQVPGGRHLVAGNPMGVVLSPQALAILVTGLAFVVNGYVLLKHLREKEIKQTKDFVISSILTDEEKQVFNALKQNGGSMTQKELSNSLGLSPVKTHRLVSRLQEKKIVKSYPFGMTNKVVIEKIDS